MLPWVDEIAFAWRATIALANSDLAEASSHGGWVFFYWGLIDAAAALQDLTDEPTCRHLGEATRVSCPAGAPALQRVLARIPAIALLVWNSVPEPASVTFGFPGRSEKLVITGSCWRWRQFRAVCRTRHGSSRRWSPARYAAVGA